MRIFSLVEDGEICMVLVGRFYTLGNTFWWEENLVEIKFGGIRGNLIWRLQRNVNFGENLIWRTENIYSGGN